MNTKSEIEEALKNTCLAVRMKTSAGGLMDYRVTGVRVKEGRLQVKTICNRAKRGYLWWDVTSVMVIWAD